MQILLPVKVLTWTGLQLPAAFQDPLVEGPLVVLSQSILSPISKKLAQNSNHFAASCSSALFLGFLLSS